MPFRKWRRVNFLCFWNLAQGNSYPPKSLFVPALDFFDAALAGARLPKIFHYFVIKPYSTFVLFAALLKFRAPRQSIFCSPQDFHPVDLGVNNCAPGGSLILHAHCVELLDKTDQGHAIHPFRGWQRLAAAGGSKRGRDDARVKVL